MPFVLRFVILIALLGLVEFYAFQALRTTTAGLSWRRWTWLAWFLVDAFILGWIVYAMVSYDPKIGSTGAQKYLLAGIVLFFIPKLLIALFMLSEDAFRLAKAAYLVVSDKIMGTSHPQYMDSRREFISKTALLAALLPFASILNGITRGKYDYTVHSLTLRFPDLPPAFHGFKLAQISDIHSGSFDSIDGVQKGIDLVNAQKADVILFTGDLVNARSEEMEPWVKLFGQLRAPMGQFSVLGNHDYSSRWVQYNDKKDETSNFQEVIDMHKRIGFTLMMNENTTLERDGQKIHLLGVENWGKPPFPQHGDLDKTLQGVPADAFSILMSHDPTHWDAKVLPHNQKIHLTLSGHTHGAQFGFELPGIKWSPVQYVYPRWAGLYEEAKQYLYVNRGFGFLGFSGRIGIKPEVTVITFEREA